MKTTRKLFYCVAPLLLAAVPTGAWAGVTIKQEMKDLKQGQVTGEVVYHLDAGRLRIITTEGKRHNDVIFIASENTIYFIDHKKKVVRVMDEASIKKMREKLEEAMKALENMPPEIRKMMPAGMGGGSIEIEPGATGQTVGRFTCRIYRILMGTTPLAETCNAPLGTLKIQQAELRTLRGMAALMEPMVQSTGGNAGMAAFSESAEGYPVRTIIFDKTGNPAREHLVTSAVREDFADAVFALPAGYKRKKMM